jgi:hypothetical protein
MTFGSFIHPLEYEGIPFRCHRFHVCGHDIADCKFLVKGKLQGSVVDGFGLGFGCTDRESGGSEGAHTMASQTLDLGRDSRRHSSSLTGLSLDDWDLAQAKVQKSSNLAFPRSLLVSGKQ